MHDEFKTQALTRLKKSIPMPLFWFTLNRRSPLSRWPMRWAPPVSLLRRQNAAAQTAYRGDRSRHLLQMQQAVPEKELLEAPTAGEGATCRSCAHCPWMAMNGLKAIAEGLEQGGAAHEIQVDAALREGALLPLNRMLDFAATLRA